MGSKKSADDRGWFVCTRKESRKDGSHFETFVLKYRIEHGAWRQHRVPPEYRTERQAERYAAAWMVARGNREPAEIQRAVEVAASTIPTVRELSEQWLKLRDANPDLAPSTKRGDKQSLDTHILPRFGDRTAAELTSGVLRPFLRDLRGIRAAFTVRNIANTFTTLLDDAMAEEWIDIAANPMRHPGVRKEFPQGIPVAGRNVIIHVPIKDAVALVTCAVVPFDWRVRDVLMFTSGMRSGEACGLAIGDVHLDDEVPYVDITKSLAEKGPSGWATMGRPKTPDAIRKVPLHSLAIPVLQAWIKSGWKEHVGRNPKPQDPLFPDQRGQWFRPDCARIFRAHLKVAGCSTTYEGKPIDFHATRRSFTTWLSMQGVQEGVIKRLLGHAGANVTQRHYTAAVLTAMRDAVNTINLGVDPDAIITPRKQP